MFARVGPGVILIAYSVLWLILGTERDWRPEWDSALYILTAQSLAQGQGYTYLDEPFVTRPPGFPWLLSFFVKEQTFDPYLLNLVVMIFAVATVAIIYWSLKRRLGEWPALAVALVAGTHGFFVKEFNVVQSEFPFLALFWLGLLLLERAAEENRGWLALTGTFLLAAAAYVRSVGNLAIPVLILLGVTRYRDRGIARAFAPALIVAVLVLPWLLHSQRVAQSEQVGRQLLLRSYVTAVLHTDPGDADSRFVSFGGWVTRIKRNGARLLDYLSIVFHLRGLWAGAVLAALSVAGFVFAVRRSPCLLDWFMVIYVVVILTYFAHSRRLLLPLLPLFVFYFFVFALHAARALCRWWPRASRILPITVSGTLLLANLVNLPTSTSVSEPTRRDWVRIRAMADWARQNTPEDAVLLCNQAPMISVLSGRRAYSSRYDQNPEMIARYGVDFVFIEERRRTTPQVGTVTVWERKRLRDEVNLRSRETWVLRHGNRTISIHRI